jgi:uncharacterized protein (DUF58 family)
MAVLRLILLVCLLIVCQVAVYCRFGLRCVDYSRSFEKRRIYAGETVTMVEVLENRKLLPVPWLRAESAAPEHLRFGRQENLDVAGGRFHKSVFFLGSYKRITRRHAVTADRRGYYDLSLVSLTAGDLLGLAQVSRDVKGDARLLVYPAVTRQDELPQEVLQWQGEVSVRRWTDPDPILTTGVREYRPGDSRRDINWRASARMDDIYVNNRDYTVQPRLLVMLNTQIRADLWGGMEPEEVEVIERGVSLAAAVACWGGANGMLPGLRANGGSVLPNAEEGLISVDSGSGGAEAVLEALAALKIEMRVPFARLLEQERERKTSGMDILCISAYWDGELEKCAEELRRAGNRVYHIPIGGKA